MHLFGFILLIVVGNVVLADEQGSSLALETVIQKHESYSAKLISAKVNWSIQDATNKESEVGELLMSPTAEVVAFGPNAGDRQLIRWDEEFFQWMVGFNIETIKNDPIAIESVIAFRYAQDMPIKRLFNWRSLRAYRLLASDPDLSLRQVCELSTTTPVVKVEDGCHVIQLTHPGSLQSNGKFLYAGGKIKVFLDPKFDFAVSRYVTIVSLKEDPAGEFSQDLSVQSMSLHSGEIFLPTRVVIVSRSGEKSESQQIQFDYELVNESIQIPSSIYVENVLIQDYPQYESADPTGFFVAGNNGEIGAQINSEVAATKVRYDKLARFVVVPRSSGFPYFIAGFFVLAAISAIVFFKKRNPII